MAENIFDDAMLKSRGLPIEKGGLRLGDIVLKRKLGAGGMGAVYEGIHTRLDSTVAVKIMHPNIASANKESIDRFMREARLAARLNTPGVIRVLDVNNIDDMYYIVMEFVEGKSLQDLVKDNGPMSEVDALKYIGEASKALGEAHDKGVIHRDIKPDNIMLEKGGRLLIADLGLAKSLLAGDEQLSMDGATMGTPSYMSPEQAMDSTNVDYRSDIYSMGATLWACLAGAAPFKAKTALQILQRVLSEQLDDIRQMRPEVSEKTAQFIKDMTSKEPHMRPGSMKAVGDEMIKYAIVLESQGKGMSAGGAAANMVAPSSMNYQATIPAGQGTPSSTTDPTMQMARQGGLPPMRRMQSTSGSAVPVKLIAGLFVFVVVIGVLIALLIGQPPVETVNQGNGSPSTTNVPTSTEPVVIDNGNSTDPVNGTTTQPATVNPDTLSDRLVLRLDGLDIAKFFIFPQTATLSGTAVGSPSATVVATQIALDAAAIALVKVKPGAFKMGVNDFPDDRLCAPIHEVEFTKPYFIGETEVTYAQFIAFVNSDSRHSRLYKEWLNGADSIPGPMVKDGDLWRLPIEAAYLPVTNITKTFADMYVNWLNETLAASLPNVDGWAVKLPSEEEWEFAARGSQSNKFPWGNDDATYIPAHLDSEGGLSGPVAVNDPRFKDDVSLWSGARGMGGNVCEWTSSSRRSYFSKKRTDPTPLTSGEMRIYRGGAYNMDLNFCRSAFRHGMTANVKKNNVGMRIYLGR